MNGTAQARSWVCAVFFFSAIAAAPARAQVPAVEQQIAGAVLAAPDSMRAGAAVLGYQGGEVVEIRKGTNEPICLADDPATDRFQVACYQKALEPFMARGRELHKLKLSHTAVDSARLPDIKAGTLEDARDTDGALQPRGAEGQPRCRHRPAARQGYPLVRRVHPICHRGASGFTTAADGSGRPWLMNPGEPWAHLMVTPR